MADLNQFIRSKDRLKEILFCLNPKKGDDEKKDSYVAMLEMSIRKLDNKIEEFHNKQLESYD
jgi:hypothetical protein